MPAWRRALPWAYATALLAAACSTDVLVVGELDGGGGDGASSHDAAVDAAAEDAGPDTHADAGQEPSAVGDDYATWGALAPADGEIALRFDAPVDAASFVLTVDPGPEPRSIAIALLRGPDGETWFDADAESAQRFEPALRSSLSEHVPYAVMLPSAPEPALEPGAYALRLRIASGDRDAPVAADVVFQRRPVDAAPRPRQLSVAMWFVPGLSLDAAQAAEDERLGAALDDMAVILETAGIELADVQHRDLPGAEPHAELEGDAELAELLALLAAAADAEARPALDLVFVERIVSSGKTVRGQTSGLPGPPAHPELARRGAVVLALETLPTSTRAAGELLAHESAHYLGLRHTSEFDGLRHDAIADTPECPQERATAASSDGTPLLTALDCGDLDGRNLLFYVPALTFAQRELTPGQAFVLTRHPLAR